MDEHLCPVCGKPGASLCAVDNKSISICKECGAVQIMDYDLIFQMDMPLAYDNNFYAASKGLALIYWAIEKGQLR